MDGDDGEENVKKKMWWPIEREIGLIHRKFYADTILDYVTRKVKAPTSAIVSFFWFN